MSAEVQALAGEYALELLDPVERSAVERRATREPVLASAIAEWRDRFLELDETAVPMTPSADLWPRIDGALNASATEAARPSPARRPSLIGRIWGDVAALRGFSLAGAAASVALAFVAVQAYDAASRQPQVIAVLLTADGKPGAVVDVFADGSSFVAPLSDVAVPADRTMQVWTKWSQEVGPVSLGLLKASSSATLRHGSLPAPKPNQLYEITLEPAGGSPTGKPTGPILFKGFAERPR